jgi:Astacin (Peptidase family M12A)
MRRTCLKFVERTNETAYVSVKNIINDGCWAELGFLGRRQEINLGDGCLYTVNTQFQSYNFKIIFKF